MTLRAYGRTIPLEGREPNPQAVLDPSSAQLHLWIAQAQRDHGNYSGREMAIIEKVAQPLADKAITMYNPLTGEIRKFDRYGNLLPR